MASDFERLAQAHMAQQVRDSAKVEAVIIRLWQSTIDPRDPFASYERFRKAAAVYTVAGNTVSQRTAAAYIAALGELSTETLGLAPLLTADPDVIAAKLASPALPAMSRAQAAVNTGKSSELALEAALSQTLGVVKREILNGGRDRIVESSRTRGFRGWSRVSDGKPCAFCLMLVSRGPIYHDDSDASGGFKAHYRCGCSPRLITNDDPSGGWTSQAREFRKLWGANPTLEELRQTLYNRRKADGLALAA